jgi:soluble lytic murein transglycosylase-like protein
LRVQTALAAPRIAVPGSAGVGLPQPLSPSEAVQVRRIFSLQAGGRMAEAVRETERLPDGVLLGAILADRYLRSQASPAELSAWLTAFGDQPEAPAIRALLEQSTPAAADAAPRPGAPGRNTRLSADARRLFVENRDNDAVASSRAPHADAEAQFVGGLAAVRLTEPDLASTLFEAAYHAADKPGLRAASALWAAKVAQRAGDRGRFAIWMHRAAQEGDTFYALIARRALAPAMACMAGDTIGNADVEALLATAPGRRAFALLQVGERRLAEAELRSLWVDTAQDGLFDHAIALAARAVGYTQLAAEIEQNRAVRPDKAALVRLQPAQDFIVDPPLIYALVRHESNFQSGAVSPTGARGLMQLMPQTAQAVAGAQAAQLHDPAVNLAIGQKYLLSLAGDEVIEGDLIRVLAGYGQGQGGLRKWVDQVRDGGDPLMFIEAIPDSPTRAFIKDELVSSWHYAAQLHLPAASLDALAVGRYPQLLRTGDARNANGRACAQIVGSR